MTGFCCICLLKGLVAPAVPWGEGIPLCSMCAAAVTEQAASATAPAPSEPLVAAAVLRGEDSLLAYARPAGTVLN